MVFPFVLLLKPKLSDIILHVNVAVHLGGRFSSPDGYMKISCKLRNLKASA